MVQGTTERNANDESKRIVKTASKLTREAIRYFDHSVNTYPSTDDIRDTKNYVPELLKFFVK